MQQKKILMTLTLSPSAAVFLLAAFCSVAAPAFAVEQAPTAETFYPQAPTADTSQAYYARLDEVSRQEFRPSIEQAPTASIAPGPDYVSRPTTFTPQVPVVAAASQPPAVVIAPTAQTFMPSSPEAPRAVEFRP